MTGTSIVDLAINLARIVRGMLAACRGFQNLSGLNRARQPNSSVTAVRGARRPSWVASQPLSAGRPLRSIVKFTGKRQTQR